MREAMFYTKLDNHEVRCELCPKHCIIPDGASGFCKIRKNIGGKLFTLNYSKLTIAIDPIEKKPLYHFYPFKKILSIGSFGCNFDCDFCQNFEISRDFTLNDLNAAQDFSPEEIIDIAKRYNIDMIAFTYNEPTVFYEFMFDVAKLAKKNYMKTVLVSNGYIEEEPLKELMPYLDAANIDLKGDNSFYRKICKGTLNPVRKTIKLLYPKVWVELTLLLIPKYHTPEVQKELFSFIASIDKNIPLHISRYFPMRRMTEKATDLDSLNSAYALAKKYLNFVYRGNVGIENTICPKCGEVLIDRFNFTVKPISDCGFKLPGRFD